MPSPPGSAHGADFVPSQSGDGATVEAKETAMNRSRFLIAFCIVLVGAVPSTQTQTTVAHAMAGVPPDTDPFLWLEQVNSPRALAWVKAQNAKTAAVLESDPHFQTFYAQTLRVYESKTRIPYPDTIAGKIYNFWQDARHMHGFFRRTSLASYLSASPVWTTVLDVDALGKADHKDWVWQGIDCAWPRERRCLVYLSDGGEDAVTIREFDLATHRFVPGGFALPRQKQNVEWEDENTLLVARAWTPGEATKSGYPYDLRCWKRGQPLSEAKQIYRGSATDVSVSPAVFLDGAGDKLRLVYRVVSTFRAQFFLLGSSGLERLDLPEESDLQGLVAGRLLVSLRESWTVGNQTFPSGSLVSIDLTNITSDPAHLKPALVFTPGPRETLDSVLMTKDHAVMVIYHDVRGQAFSLTPAAGDSWIKQQLSLPDNLTVALDDSNLRNNTIFLYATGFLTPTTLYMGDAATGALSAVKARPPQFDASKDVVEQQEATSKDGTQIPYFVVRPKDTPFDGTNPTVLDGYGGFQISSTPSYDSVMGKLWLARGGTYVLANIRGGGEFGPAWHEAGLKSNRQRVYDDFYAVARDLVARKITSPRYLGIEGASNGGLLMGVEFEQHPEMWNAVSIGIPLLDMLRYEQLAAGASWVDEYGSVSNPGERAFLASISPYQNIRPGVAYPEPFIWTTSKDDRVGPQQARKFAAKLDAMGVNYLFYEVIAGGHAYGDDLSQDAHTVALQWTYFTQKLMPAP
jgi:prolyl oligopeptidase